jgi:hypothetical protein
MRHVSLQIDTTLRELSRMRSAILSRRKGWKRDGGGQKLGNTGDK